LRGSYEKVSAGFFSATRLGKDDARASVDPCAANLALQGGVKSADTVGVLYGG